MCILVKNVPLNHSCAKLQKNSIRWDKTYQQVLTAPLLVAPRFPEFVPVCKGSKHIK